MLKNGFRNRKYHFASNQHLLNLFNQKNLSGRGREQGVAIISKLYCMAGYALIGERQPTHSENLREIWVAICAHPKSFRAGMHQASKNGLVSANKSLIKCTRLTALPPCIAALCTHVSRSLETLLLNRIYISQYAIRGILKKNVRAINKTFAR